MTVAIGVGTLALILLLKPFKRLPGLLIAVVAATLVVGLLGLDQSAGVKVLGPLPQGLPSFALPWIGFADLRQVVIGGCAVAMVAFADTSVLSRTYAAKTRTRVDPNKEMIGLGAANLAAGLFQGFPISSSSSRTPVAESAGAQTQLTSVIGAVAIAVMLVALPGLLADLPSTTLAAVVISAGLSLIDVRSVARLWQIGSAEFWLSMTTFVGVAFVGVIEGVFLAVGLSLVAFIQRAWWPHDAVLGRADGVKGYHDLTYYPDARQVPGLLLYRFDGPLFFANADVFRDRIRERISASEVPVRWVVIAAEPITDVDTTAAEVLDRLHSELATAGITLAFAELKDPVKARLRRYGALANVTEDRIFPTVGTAVDAYLVTTGESWTDWEEDGGSNERPTDTEPPEVSPPAP
jgi:MFS superfamily sulfate permease-like transporter